MLIYQPAGQNLRLDAVPSVAYNVSTERHNIEDQVGTVNHNAVVATTWDKVRFSAVQEWVAALEVRSVATGADFRTLFAFAPSVANGCNTVVLAPDGSKEGWPDSEDGDRLREAFIRRLEEDAYSDGSSSWKWIEVSFGEFGQSIVRGNNKNVFAPPPEELR